MIPFFDHTWRKARKSDRSLIQSTFECAEVPPGDKFAPPWEAEVQRFLRHHAITSANRMRNLGHGGRCLIGVDDQGVAAALTHYRMCDADFDEEDEGLKTFLRSGPPVREIAFLGVHLRHRHSGGAVANDALDAALHDILDCEPDANLVYVVGRADYRNTSSERMLARNHFTKLKAGVPPPHENTRLSWWARRLARPTAADY